MSLAHISLCFSVAVVAVKLLQVTVAPARPVWQALVPPPTGPGRLASNSSFLGEIRRVPVEVVLQRLLPPHPRQNHLRAAASSENNAEALLSF